MKKITMLLLAMLLVVSMSVGAFTVSAKQYTKDDLIEVVSHAAIYKHIEGELKNLARTIDATDAQLNELYVVAEKFAALDLKDKGNNAHFYTAAEIQSVMNLIDEVCRILNLHYTFTPSTNPKHVGDTVFTVYDANNKVIFVRDSDVIKKTGTDNLAWLIAAGAAGCLLLAGAVVTKKRYARV